MDDPKDLEPIKFVLKAQWTPLDFYRPASQVNQKPVLSDSELQSLIPTFVTFHTVTCHCIFFVGK